MIGQPGPSERGRSPRDARSGHHGAVKILMVVNPSASSVTPRTHVVIQKALSADHDVTVAETSRRGHAARLSQDAAMKNMDLVVVLGGDGTLNEAANGLAGTDTVHHRAFAESAEEHRRDLVRLLNEDLAENGADLGFMYAAGPELWARMPRFRYHPPPPDETAVRLAPGWLAMGLWLLGASGLVAWSSRSLRID